MNPRVSRSGLDSAFLLRLPVHRNDPVEQFLAVSYEAELLKRLHADLGISALGQWAEFAPAALLGRAARFYSEWKLAGRHRRRHNLAISDIRGPGTPLYAAGARLTAAHPLGLLMEGVGINITVVSYMGSIDFGVIACERSVPHPGDTALGFGAAVARLHKIALEKTRKAPSMRRKRAAPDAVPASVPSN